MSYQPRVNFGRPLEPDGDRILHGGGQDMMAFSIYSGLLHPYRPKVYMAYLGMKSKRKAKPEGVLKWMRYGVDDSLPLEIIPQIGLGMTYDGDPEKHYEQDVAAGKYDEYLEAFCREMKEWGRPAFVRIGYEFNGQWNGYEPETFRAAYRHVAEAFRSHELNVATVWCYAPEGDDKDFMAYYPGDDVVDWWSADTFDVEHFTAPDTLEFLAEAERRRYPVMIGETTCRRVTVLNGEKSWDGWFGPYFKFMQDHPTIKATCYINWVWDRFPNHPEWADWGDCRLQMNEVVLQKYRKAIADPVFIHALNE